MKYIVILGDGMADYPIESIGGNTPLSIANKPTIDYLAQNGEVGLCKTIPQGMKPGSDTANLSVMGYDPRKYYTGRSPLEAVSIGIDLKDTDVTLRCNLVTLSDEPIYEDKHMLDYSSGEITTAESTELINYLKNYLDTKSMTFYSGISYRHCLVVDNGKIGHDLTPPHDISDKPILTHLPKGEMGDTYLELMKRSYELLKNHPININRKKQGKNPANSIWLWGEGTKPALSSFEEKFGIKGAVISAVDLIKGIGILAKMTSINVPNVTGNIDTNFKGKAEYAVKALLNDGFDFVYLHMEAPDECGHQGNLKNKIKAIELIDSEVVKYIKEKLDESGEKYSILVCPDHPTPIALKTHVSDPIPYIIYRNYENLGHNADSYTEENAKKTGMFIDEGCELIAKLINK